jgi:hypothetical protein
VRNLSGGRVFGAQSLNAGPTAANRVVKYPIPQGDEWLPWTEYVYLWACAMPGGMHVKVGMTNNPDRRATEFRTNSPLRVHRHVVCQCPDRSASYGLEQTILAEFKTWKARGEWVRVPADRLDAFIATCTRIARREIGPIVRFRDYKPRRPNGEPFRKRGRR